jgi:hypothetical protein
VSDEAAVLNGVLVLAHAWRFALIDRRQSAALGRTGEKRPWKLRTVWI